MTENSNNNNNNNLANAPIDKYGLPNKIDNLIYPAILGLPNYKIGSIYAILRQYIKADITSLQTIQAFLKQYNLALFVTDGHTITKWSGEDFQRHLTNDKCSYDGERATNAGCKRDSVSEKLSQYMDFMEKIMIAFLGKLSKELKEQMILDGETMTLFAAVIRNLLYFFGQKATGPILRGKENHLVLFFTQVNTLFGKDVLHVACNKDMYGCGRFVIVAQCDTSKEFYVLIHSTKGTNNNTASNNYGLAARKRSESCGGSRRKKRRRTMKRKH